MDKRVIFAVAGSGKTTFVVDSLSLEKRSLIVTYTTNNYYNLLNKITDKFGGICPQNISLMTYFQFLYNFCYKPFLSDRVKAKGIIFERNPNNKLKKSDRAFYITKNGYLYSNRIAMLLGIQHTVTDIRSRIKKYFDEFIIDEIQDIAGRDFDFLEQLMPADVNMTFVGDFFQHTYDTSRDGNANKNLFADKSKYEKRFVDKGFVCDFTTLVNSWRCSGTICKYIYENLGIEIYSNRKDDTEISYVSDVNKIRRILNDDSIVKLHYKNGIKYGEDHKNWGDTKGEDCYQDVCVLLNKNTMLKYSSGKLMDLPQLTKNKLYVAITRAHRNCYFIDEKYLKSI